jgi:hypothetical protein
MPNSGGFSTTIRRLFQPGLFSQPPSPQIYNTTPPTSTTPLTTTTLQTHRSPPQHCKHTAHHHNTANTPPTHNTANTQYCQYTTPPTHNTANNFAVGSREAVDFCHLGQLPHHIHLLDVVPNGCIRSSATGSNTKTICWRHSWRHRHPRLPLFDVSPLLLSTSPHSRSGVTNLGLGLVTTTFRRYSSGCKGPHP